VCVCVCVCVCVSPRVRARLYKERRYQNAIPYILILIRNFVQSFFYERHVWGWKELHAPSGEYKEKASLRRHKRRWEDDTKIDHKQEGMMLAEATN